MSKIQKALEKAKEMRGDFFDRFTPAPEAPEEAENSQGRRRRERREEAQAPVYLHTRTVSADFEHLLQNHIIPDCKGSSAANRVKMLRTHILAKMANEGKNALLITSANPGEGKTLTAINLAISISQEMDRTTLLVDSDLRKPSVHSYFGFEANQGLSDYLRKDIPLSALLVSPGIEKLVILPGGRPLTNSSELLGSPKMESLVMELKERYSNRFIIFDSCSLLEFADPLVLARFIDGILLVVEAEKTTRNDLKRAFELLKDRPVIGTLLNKLRD